MKRLLWLVPLLWYSQAWAIAPTFVSASWTTTSSGTCSITGISVTSGQEIILFGVSDSLAGTLGLGTNSDLGTMTAAGAQFEDAALVLIVQAWTGQVSNTDVTSTLNVTNTSSANFLWCGYYLMTTASLDKNPGAVSNDVLTSITTAASGTLSNATELVVGLFGNKGAANQDCTATGGFTLRTTNGASIRELCIEDLTTSTTGTQTATATLSNVNTGGAAYLLSFAPASGGVIGPNGVIGPKGVIGP